MPGTQVTVMWYTPARTALLMHQLENKRYA